MPLELKTVIQRHLLTIDKAQQPRRPGQRLPSALWNLSQVSRLEWEATASASAALFLHRQNVDNLAAFAAFFRTPPSTSSHEAHLAARPAPLYDQLGEFKKDGLASLIKNIPGLQTPAESAAAFKIILQEAKLLPARDALMVLLAEALAEYKSSSYLQLLTRDKNNNNVPNIFIDLVESASKRERHMVVEALTRTLPSTLDNFNFCCANLLPLCDQGMPTAARISLALAMAERIPRSAPEAFDQLRTPLSPKNLLSDVVLLALTPRLSDLAETEMANTWDFILEQARSYPTKEVLGQYLANAVNKMPFEIQKKKIEALHGENFSTPATIGSIGAAHLSQIKFWSRRFDTCKRRFDALVQLGRGDADNFAQKHKITLAFWRRFDPRLEQVELPQADVRNIDDMEFCYNEMSQIGAELKSFRLRVKDQPGETDGLAELAHGVADLVYTGPEVISDDEIRELVRQSLAALVREDPNLSDYQHHLLVRSLIDVLLKRSSKELEAELGEAIHAVTSTMSNHRVSWVLEDMVLDPFPFRRPQPENIFKLVLAGPSDQDVKISSVQGLKFLPEELRWNKFQMLIGRDERPGPALAQEYAKAVFELPLANRLAALNAVATAVKGARHETIVLKIMNGEKDRNKNYKLTLEDCKKAFSLMMDRLEVLCATPTIHTGALCQFAESMSETFYSHFLSEAEVVQNWNRIFNCVHDHRIEDQLTEKLSIIVRLYPWSNGGEAGKILLNKMVDRAIEKKLMGTAKYLVEKVFQRTHPILPMELTPSQTGTLAKVAAVTSAELKSRYAFTDSDFELRLGITAEELDQAYDEFF